MNIENLAIEKENRADGLVLGGSSDSFLVGQSSDEFIDLCHAHLAGMALVVVQDKLSDPADIGVFGTEGIMAVAEDFAVLIEQLFGFP